MKGHAFAILLATAAWSFAPPARSAETQASDTCMSAAESAQKLRLQGKLLESKRQLAACAADTCPAFVRSDCTKWEAQVADALPSLVFRAVDAQGHDVRDVEVRVDGSVVATSLDGRPVAVDPGPHAVRFARAGLWVARSLVVGEGEHDRLVSVVLAAAAAPAAGPSGPPDTTGAAAGAHHAMPLLPIAVGAAGLAAIGGAAAFWIAGLDQRSQLAGSCAPQHACSDAQVDSSRTKLVVGDVLGAAGLVALGAASWLWLASDAPRTTSVGLSIVGRGAGVSAIVSHLF